MRESDRASSRLDADPPRTAMLTLAASLVWILNHSNTAKNRSSLLAKYSYMVPLPISALAAMSAMVALA